MVNPQQPFNSYPNKHMTLPITPPFPTPQDIFPPRKRPCFLKGDIKNFSETILQDSQKGTMLNRFPYNVRYARYHEFTLF